MNNSNAQNENSGNAVTSPIPITPNRGRRSSIASTLPPLSTSPTSPIQASIQTPVSSLSYGRFGHNRSNSIGGPGGSPTSPLAYFLGTAATPLKSGGAFPFNTKVAQSNAVAVEEEEEGPPGSGSIGLFGVGGHTRRASWAQNGGFAGSTAAVPPPPANDRGTSVLRRLSLSSPFQRPYVLPPAPPPSAVSPTGPGVPNIREPKPTRRLARAATLSVPGDPVKKRGISPMGERLLKGHFDGFI